MKNSVDKYLADNSFIVGLIKSKDKHHLKCNSFWEDSENVFVIPAIACFECQATISRKAREDRIIGTERGIYLDETRVEKYDITYDLIKKSSDNNLFEKFSLLKGADLIYACIAWIEGYTLVTVDEDFLKYKNEISVHFIE